MRVLVEDMRTRWSELDRRIAELDKEFVKWTRKEEAARRLMTIPGIGVLNATALIAAIGQGRELCARTGLGGLARLGAAAGNDRRQTASGRNQQAGQQISPQAFDPRCPGRLANAACEPDSVGSMAARADGENAQKCCRVALANKLARMASAVLRHDETFRINVSVVA
jgi:transposase